MPPRNGKRSSLFHNIYIAYRRSPLGRSLARNRPQSSKAIPQFRRIGLALQFLRANKSKWQVRRQHWLLSIARYIYSWRITPSVSVPAHGPVQVVCIADTHNRELPLPPGNILIHAGDLTKDGTFDELQAQLDWLNSLPHPHKIVIAGNHDLVLVAAGPRGGPLNSPGKTRSDLRWGDIIYLEDQVKELQLANGRAIKVFGSPRTPCYDMLAFGYSRLQNVWRNLVPDGTDILVTHGPPRGHCDIDGRGRRHAGCDHLLTEIWRVRPRLAVFGHIHSGYGQEVVTYGAIDDTFEDVVVRNGGFSRCFGLLFLLARQRFRSALCIEVPSKGATRMVNAAVGGPFSKSQRGAIVVQI